MRFILARLVVPALVGALGQTAAAAIMTTSWNPGLTTGTLGTTALWGMIPGFGSFGVDGTLFAVRFYGNGGGDLTFSVYNSGSTWGTASGSFDFKATIMGVPVSFGTSASSHKDVGPGDSEMVVAELSGPWSKTITDPTILAAFLAPSLQTYTFVNTEATLDPDLVLSGLSFLGRYTLTVEYRYLATSASPESGTLGLVAAGIAIIAFGARRRRRSRPDR